MSSLRGRLWSAGALGVAVAAITAALLLGTAFDRASRRAFEQRLVDDFNTVAGLVEIGQDGQPSLQREPADDRFRRVFSGWYWQVEAGDRRWQSRSLWDGEIEFVQPPVSGPQQYLDAEGPRAQPLRVLTQMLRLPGAASQVRITVAGEVAEMRAATREFRVFAAVAVAAIASALLALLAWQVRYGLRPLMRLRETLARVQQGEDVRFGDRELPSEVVPLAAQIDTLLDEHARRVERARNAAQDLAHELKTPLAVLAAESQRPGATIASVVDAQVRRMQASIDRRLAAGFAADARQRTAIAPVVEALCALIAASAPARELSFERDVSADLVFAGRREDLEEMLGNLIENAAKWARRTVRVDASLETGRLLVRICDDGPGIPEHAMADALARGVRLDERMPGSGLGLSITDDLARSYGGVLRLRNLEDGLCAELDLPSGLPAQ